MKCPKCSSEMQSGYLQTGNIVAFNKQRHKISLNPNNSEDTMIAKHTFSSSSFNGYICKKCGLVIFDYTNSNAK